MPAVWWPGCFSAPPVVRDEGGGVGPGRWPGLPNTVSSMPLGLKVSSDSEYSVTLAVLIGLAIVSVPTWIFVNNFGAYPGELSVAKQNLTDCSDPSTVEWLGPDSFPQGDPHRIRSPARPDNMCDNIHEDIDPKCTEHILPRQHDRGKLGCCNGRFSKCSRLWRRKPVPGQSVF